VERSWAEAAESLHMLGRGIALVLSETIAGVRGIEFFEAGVAMSLGKDGSSGDGNASGVALDEGFLLDKNVELHGIDQEVVWNDGELLEGSGHGLAAGLIDIPSVDAGGVDFGDCVSKSMFANAEGEFAAAFGGKLFRIVKADHAALGVENDGCSDNGAEEGSATGFVEAGDARPAKLAGGSLKTGRAETGHFPAPILACPATTASTGLAKIRAAAEATAATR